MVFKDARFRKYSLKNGMDGASSFPIPDAYNYWSQAQVQDDSVSFQKFLHLSTSFDITFSKSMSPLDEDIWIRVDLVQVKKHMLHSPAHMLAMPDDLQGPRPQEHGHRSWFPGTPEELPTTRSTSRFSPLAGSS